MLYVAWKRGVPRKCARFVLFHSIKRRSFNLLCVWGLFSESCQSNLFQIFLFCWYHISVFDYIMCSRHCYFRRKTCWRYYHFVVVVVVVLVKNGELSMWYAPTDLSADYTTSVLYEHYSLFNSDTAADWARRPQRKTVSWRHHILNDKRYCLCCPL